MKDPASKNTDRETSGRAMEKGTSVKLWPPYADTCTPLPYAQQTHMREGMTDSVIDNTFFPYFICQKVASEAMLETVCLALSVSLSVATACSVRSQPYWHMVEINLLILSYSLCISPSSLVVSHGILTLNPRTKQLSEHALNCTSHLV